MFQNKESPKYNIHGLEVGGIERLLSVVIKVISGLGQLVVSDSCNYLPLEKPSRPIKQYTFR